MRTIKETLELIDKYQRDPNRRADWSDVFVEELREIFTDDRLREICEAEREGRCEILPFPVGTKLYYGETDGILKGHIQEIIVHGYSESRWQGHVNNGKDYKFIICHNSYNEPHAYQLCFVHSTREKAETALKEHGR